MLSLSALELVPSEAKGREWLVSNGAGAYSSSTVIGMNTRKYHGLLVAPLSGLGKRHVMLSKLEETATIGGREFQLSTNSYHGAVYPDGYRHQVGFSFSDHPEFVYSLDGAMLEKSVRMPHGKAAVVISYRLASGREAHLSVRPMLAPRPIHADPGSPEVRFEADRSGFWIGSPARMRLNCSSGKFSPSPQKYHDMVYEAEKERGYAFAETLSSPGAFEAVLGRGDEMHIVASLEGLAPSEALDALDRQELRLTHLAESYCRQNGAERTDFSDALVLAADSFVSVSEKRCGIIAGYHWFSEWTRDSMISLPGLLLCTGRGGLAREILSLHAGRMKDGLLPSFIDEEGNAHYASSDASLWFVNAVHEYAERTGDWQAVRGMWKCLRGWLSSTIRGNALAGMDSDCLLKVSGPASTWMDAQAGGRAVTPRSGKPVEINALWHSNLHFMKGLAERFEDRRSAELCAGIIETLCDSFQKFASPDGGLLDVLEPNDATVRPNQIFAVSLPHSPLNAVQKRHVFNIVRSKLYTPLGLRTLPADDARFHETYSGNQEQRDAAYHQGMIWPWLLGAFYDAQMEVYPGSGRQVLSSLRPLWESMDMGCIGSLPEIYEPKSGRPAGAVSQAWSVAEVLRIYAKVKGNDAGRQARPDVLRENAAARTA